MIPEDDLEARLRDAIQRRERARTILEDTLIAKAFSDLESQYMEAMLAIGHDDDKGRFRLTQAILVLRKVKGHLRKHVEDGDIAARELDEISRLGDRRKVFGVPL